MYVFNTKRIRVNSGHAIKHLLRTNYCENLQLFTLFLIRRLNGYMVIFSFFPLNIDFIFTCITCSLHVFFLEILIKPKF